MKEHLVGDRFVFEGMTIEVIPSVGCKNCIMKMEGDLNEDDEFCCGNYDDEGNSILGPCDAFSRSDNLSVGFVQVGTDGDVDIGHKMNIAGREIVVEKSEMICKGCFLESTICKFTKSFLKLGSCVDTRKDGTDVIFREIKRKEVKNL